MNEDVNMQYVLIAVVSIGMLLFTVGSVYLSIEDHDQREKM